MRIPRRRSKLILVPAALAVALLILSACAILPGRRSHRVRVAGAPSAFAGVVYVKKAPPKAIVEVRPAKPAGTAVWIPGHWVWRGGKYTWKPGHWDKRPKGRAWIPGHWERKPRGWFWVPGHWR